MKIPSMPPPPYLPEKLLQRTRTVCYPLFLSSTFCTNQYLPGGVLFTRFGGGPHYPASPLPPRKTALAAANGTPPLNCSDHFFY